MSRRTPRPWGRASASPSGYVGEVYRKGSEGRWAKPKGSDAPTILAGNGRWSFSPFVDVVVPMFEPSKRGPLYDTVGARLTGYNAP
jgi:hypothetical protein